MGGSATYQKLWSRVYMISGGDKEATVRHGIDFIYWIIQGRPTAAAHLPILIFATNWKSQIVLAEEPRFLELGSPDVLVGYNYKYYVLKQGQSMGQVDLWPIPNIAAPPGLIDYIDWTQWVTFNESQWDLKVDHTFW